MIENYLEHYKQVCDKLVDILNLDDSFKNIQKIEVEDTGDYFIYANIYVDDKIYKKVGIQGDSGMMIVKDILIALNIV